MVSQEKQVAAMEMSAEDSQISHVNENHTARRVLQEAALAASMEYKHSEQENNPIPHTVGLRCVPAGLTQPAI